MQPIILEEQFITEEFMIQTILYFDELKKCYLVKTFFLKKIFFFKKSWIKTCRNWEPLKV